MGVTLNYGVPVFPGALDSAAGTFPSLTDGIHNIMASHPNSLADAIEAIEAKLGVNNSVVVGTIDYILKKGRHTSTQAGAGTGTTAYEFDTANAHTGDDVLLMLKSGGVERWRVGGGGATTTYVEMGFGSAATVSPAGKGRLRYNESTNRWEISTNTGPFFPIAIDASGGFVTLDDAYDAGGAGAGRVVTADSGAVRINNAVADATSTLELFRSNTGTGFGLALIKSGTAAAAGSQAASSKTRMTASMWDGAAEVERDFDWYSAVTATDETDVTGDPGRARMALDYEGFRVLEIFSDTTVPGATPGVVFRSSKAAGAAPGMAFRLAADWSSAQPGFIFEDNESSTLAIIYGDGSIQSQGGVMLPDGVYGGTLAARYTSDTDLGFYRQAANNMGVSANTLTIRSPASDPATVWMNNAGAGLFSLSISSAIHASFSTTATLTGGWRFNKLAAASVEPVGHFIQFTGTAGAGHALLAASRSLTAGVDPPIRVWQLDGDALISHTNRITGAVGPEYRLIHNDGEIGVLDDVLGRFIYQGADGTTVGTMRDYVTQEGVIHVATAGATVGRFDYRALAGGTLSRRFLSMRPTSDEAEAGVIFHSRRINADTAPPFIHRAGVDFTAGFNRILAQWEDNDGAAAADIKMMLTAEGRIRLRSPDPSNNSGFLVENTSGTTQFGLLGNNGEAQFQSVLAFRIYSQLAPGATALAAIQTIGGTWSAGQPLWAIGHNVANDRVYQFDGDSMTTITGRIANGSPETKGVELQTYHNDGAAGVTDDIIAQWTVYGQDSANTKQQYTAIQSVIQSPTSPTETGRWDFRAVDAGTFGRLFSMYPDGTIAAETGTTIENFIPAGTAASMWTWYLEDDTATAGPSIGLWRFSTTPTALDEIGRINFFGQSSTGVTVGYSGIKGLIIDPTNASKDGGFRFRALGGNTARDFLDLFSPDGGVVMETFLAAAAGASQFEMRLTEASVTVGPILSLFRNRATDAADNDLCGAIAWDGMDDGTPSRVRYGRMNGLIRDSGAGSEDFGIEYHMMNAGTLARILELRPDPFATAGADRGVQFKNYIAAGTTPAFEHRAVGNFGSGQGMAWWTNNNGGNTPMQIDGDGDVVVQKDIEAVGGYKAPIAHWAEDNIAASQSNNVMDLWAVGSNRQLALVAYAGSIVAIVTRVLAGGPITAGTLTIEVTVNGSVVFTQTITSGSGDSIVTTQAKDVDPVAAGDRIGVQFDTDAGFLPSGTVDVSVAVYVEQ